MGAAFAEAAGGGPENPLGDAAAGYLGNLGRSSLMAGSSLQASGAAVLLENGMPRDALNTAIEAGMDFFLPDAAGPFVDPLEDEALNGIEDTLGVAQNSCQGG